MPDFTFEDQYEGIICGIDEVGRGPLSGPVVAAAVIIPKEVRKMEFISAIQDSKKLSAIKREYLHTEIVKHCPYAITEIQPAEIDEINILQASLKAMKTACKYLMPINQALIDGNKIPQNLPCSAQAIVKGDAKSVSIAAASIIAKVHRDKIMQELDRQYPQYGWSSNAGYPTKQHRDALLQYGITPHHRKSFAPVRGIIEKEKLSA